MTNFANFKKSILSGLMLLIALAMIAPAGAAELGRDAFDYTPQILDDVGLWRLRAGETDAFNIVSGNLAYTDANETVLGTNGNMITASGAVGSEETHMMFNTPDSPNDISQTMSTYASFLFKNTVLPTGNTYFAYFNFNNDKWSRGRLYVKPNGTDGYEFGIRYSDSPTEFSADPIVMKTGETHMCVMRTDRVPGANNNVTYIFIDPILNGVEPAVAYAASSNGANEKPDIVGFSFRERANNGDWEFDEVRVGTTWADVTGSDATVNEAPRTTDRRPANFDTIYGPMTHVSVKFTEGVSGVDAGDLSVNGSQAILLEEDSPGIYVFSGFTPVAGGELATMTLAPGAIKDISASAVAFEGAIWTADVLTAPTGNLITEHFNYATSTTLVGVPIWDVTDNNLKEHMIVNNDTLGDNGTSSLQFPGLTNFATGGRLWLKKNTVSPNIDIVASDDIELAVPVVGNISVYASFLYKPLTLAGDQYLLYFSTNGSVQSQIGRVWVMNDDGTDQLLGVSFRGTDTRVISTRKIPMGETVLVVIKQTLAPGAADTVELWINPTPGSIESAASAADHISADSTADLTNRANPAGGIDGVSFRMNDRSKACEVDELRVGLTWESVTADTADTADPVLVDKFPENTAIGSVSHVQVRFDEPVLGVTADMLTVDGDVATTVTGRGTGPYTFELANPVTEAKVVDMVLAAGAVDAVGKTYAGESWTVTLADPMTITDPLLNGLFIHEPFDYADDTALVDSALWVGDAMKADAKVLVGNGSSASLYYPLLEGITGGRVIATQRPTNYIQSATSFLSIDTPIIGEGSSLYVSFLFKPTGLPGDVYVAAFTTEGAQGSTIHGRFNISTNNEPNHTIGARYQDTNEMAEELGGGHAAGETVLVVAKVSLVPGEDNDTMEMWINPTVGLSERTGQVVSTADNNQDINPARGISEFRVRTTNGSSSFEIDELRIGATWESVTPATIIVIPKASTQNWLLYN